MTTARPEPPAAVRWIVRTLEEAGHETWAVGGAVRDVVAGRPAGDWDLTTRAKPQEMRKLFRRTVPIGVEHGTIGVLARDGTMYEVTTFRKDVETDGRHAVVAFAETVEEDLARRDFTINAIAWHPLREELLDPFGGAADLGAGILRTVGAPVDRFAEDHLRILRALRFASRFELDIESATWDALRSAVDELPELSAERIREELLKTLGADPRPSRALQLYADSGALAVLYPELDAVRRADEPEWTLRLATVDRLAPGRPLLRLAGLVRGLQRREAAQLLSRLKLSNLQTDEVGHLAGAPPLPAPSASDEALRRWLAGVGPQRLTPLARLDLARARASQGAEGVAVVEAWRRAKALRRSGVPLSVGDLAVDGRDLIKMGLEPGPEFGIILEALLDRVLAEPELNTRSSLEALVAARSEAGS